MNIQKYDKIRFRNGYVEYVGIVDAVVDDSVWVKDEDGHGHLIFSNMILEKL